MKWLLITLTVLLGSVASVLFSVKHYLNQPIVPTQKEIVFADSYNVRRGNKLNIFYNLLEKTTFTLYRLGSKRIKIGSFTLEDAYSDDVVYNQKNGLNLKHIYSLDTKSLVSGYYFIQGTSGGIKFTIPFIVYDPECAGINIIASTNTWLAYNDYVRSNYNDRRPVLFRLQSKAEDLMRRLLARNLKSKHLPVLLPYKRPSTFAQALYDVENVKPLVNNLMLEWQMITVMEMEEISYCVLDDFVFSYETFYEEADAFIFNGHSEYWSKGMIRQLDSLIAADKKILFSGGNNIYREIEFSANGITVVNSRIAENITAPRIGSYYSNHGYGTYAPMRALHRDHWVFEGVNNEIFGRQSLYSAGAMKGGISGHETDKVSFYSRDFEVLARGLNQKYSGGADMVIREGEKGWVLNFSSLSFVGGYFVDTDTAQILRNVLRRMTNE